MLADRTPPDINSPVHRSSGRMSSETMSSDGAAVSRRSALRGLMSTASALALAGCATFAATPGPDAAAIVTQPTVLVATTRKPVNGGHGKPWFAPERGRTTTVARARLRPPSDSRFSLSAVGLGDWTVTAVEPAPKLADLLGETANRDMLLYVHGYNQTFEQAVIDAAHLSNGIKFAGETMVFSWPSRAQLLDYDFDRESAMWSRDALDQVIEDLLASPAVGRVNIVAHSVGTMLTTEALRELYAKLGDYAADRVGAIVLASPDIDMDVFTAAIPKIGPLASKITVITATDDRALAMSRLVNGSITRVGAAEKTQLEKLGLKVIDASQQGWGVLNHDRFLSNTGTQQAIRDAIGGPPRIGSFTMPSIQLGGSLPPPDGAQASPQVGASTN
jgi:esterase/lipase superfamily enzyme